MYDEIMKEICALVAVNLSGKKVAVDKIIYSGRGMNREFECGMPMQMNDEIIAYVNDCKVILPIVHRHNLFVLLNPSYAVETKDSTLAAKIYANAIYNVLKELGLETAPF